MAINGSINLLKYQGAKKLIINGTKGIFIPVDENPTIFVGDKGAYASVRIVEHESSFGDKTYTHFIAASIDSKKRREELEAKYGKDAIKSMTPILGNANNGSASESSASEENYTSVDNVDIVDDMPF